ncbi:hypothetical protein [Streptomyces albidochromogenes]|uniref:Uncharacterized protein n=1 Tax=Streptomyces albidochromogenes TaxID=329524 RepID=A0ABW6FI30_9ACTN
MPATLTTPHLVPASAPVPTLSVQDLSNMERAVALYASGMPSCCDGSRAYRPKMHDWIIQGAQRLGQHELRLSAAYLRGFILLDMAGLATPDQKRAHRVRFPNAARLHRAEQSASGFTWFEVAPSSTAHARGLRLMVEGDCLCGETGWINASTDPDDPTCAVLRNCPVHNPNGTRPVRQAVAA